MNKSILRALIFVIISSISSICLSNEIIEYHNEYKGLIVTKSTLTDAISVLGNPVKMGQVSKTVRYRFKGVDITAYSDTGLINSIIIYDKLYVDDNGISVGNNFDSVKQLPEIKILTTTIFDPKNGIVYWFNENRVTKIVLVGRAQSLIK